MRVLTRNVPHFPFPFVFGDISCCSYNRWWEAYTAVYLMHSKWLDLATEIAAFHYQSRRYDRFKPPSFGANPGVQSLDFHVASFWDASVRSSQDDLLRTSDFSSGRNVAQQEGNVLTPPASPRKQTRLSPMMSPNARTRHTRKATLTSLIQEMDAAEAEEEEMKRQSLISERSKENEDGDIDNAGMFPSSDGDLDEIDSELGEGGREAVGREKKSWLRKLRDRRSEAKAERRAKKVEKHRRLSAALSVHFDSIVTTNRDYGNVNSSRNHRKGDRGKQKMKRRRSRHQPATARFFEQRKTIARNRKESGLPHEEQLEFHDRFDVKTGKPYSIFTAFSRKHLREGHLDPDDIPPMLFLEECAHLLSLMSAVAFSTLRNDLAEAESPLTSFEPGLPWPLVDPDGYKSKVRVGWTQSKSRLYSVLQFALGRSRNVHARTLYNAARPFRVIGNVSDAEIEKLQQARGPLAKVSLISMWLLELISREYQAGSTGDVAPPIITRLYQFLSEGLAGYNQARKIAYIPFPFPHAQITTLYLLVVDFFVTPLLMTTFVTDVTLGFFLNLFSVLCFTGLHEVAREIENPFQNVPNDVPLNNYQAQFNEGLMVMFYGYHPDAYWNIKQSDEFNDSSPGTQNEFKSPGTEASAKSDLNYKSFQVPLNDKLNSKPPPANKEPVGFSVEGDHQEGLAQDTKPNSGGVNRTSTVDGQTDAFLRGLVASRFDTSSVVDSFQKVPSETDSFRRGSDNSRGARSSPVVFRIPKRAGYNTEDVHLTSDESKSSPIIPSKNVDEKVLDIVTKSSD